MSCKWIICLQPSASATNWSAPQWQIAIFCWTSSRRWTGLYHVLSLTLGTSFLSDSRTGVQSFTCCPLNPFYWFVVVTSSHLNSTSHFRDLSRPVTPVFEYTVFPIGAVTWCRTKISHTNLQVVSLYPGCMSKAVTWRAPNLKEGSNIKTLRLSSKSQS